MSDQIIAASQLPPQLLQPMAIAPGWRNAMAREWLRWKASASSASPQVSEPATVEGAGGILRIANGVGIIMVSGPLTNDDGLWSQFIASVFGGTSYPAIWRALETARASAQVQRILMRFRTPGGDADGCGELGRYIFETRQIKPIRAHVDTRCDSGGLWLASQCEEITSVAEGEVGSIGVRCSYFDLSKFDEMNGIERGEIISSLSPGKRSVPFDDEVKGRIQVHIDDLAELFVSAVATGRGVDRDEVIGSYGGGDVMIASRALDVGLIDGICDFNQALSSFNAQPVSSPESRAAARAQRKATLMSTTTQPEVSEQSASAAAGARCAKCDADMAGKKAYCASCYDDHDEPDGDEDDDEAKAAKAFRSQALALAGTTDPDQALGLIRAGVEAIAAQRAAEVAAAEKAKADAKATVLAAVESSVRSGRLELAAVPGLADFLEADDAALRDKLAAATDLPAVLAALDGGTFSAKDGRRISAYLGAKGPALPESRREPPANSDHLAVVAIDEATAKKFGLKPEAVAKYLNMNSVADLPARKGA